MSKWWFHLYTLILESSDNNSEDLSTVLEQFMESSSLGEYQARLNLLYVFHCHAVNDGLSKCDWSKVQDLGELEYCVDCNIKSCSQKAPASFSSKFKLFVLKCKCMVMKLNLTC